MDITVKWTKKELKTIEIVLQQQYKFHIRGIQFSSLKAGLFKISRGGGGGHTTFFFFRYIGVCGPDFRSVGLANWHLPLKRGEGELVSGKFPNFGACELKKFGWKLRLLRLKFPNFLKRGSCEPTLLLEMGPLRAAGDAWKGGLQGLTSPYPPSRSWPPGRFPLISRLFSKSKQFNWAWIFLFGHFYFLFRAVMGVMGMGYSVRQKQDKMKMKIK